MLYYKKVKKEINYLVNSIDENVFLCEYQLFILKEDNLFIYVNWFKY